MQRVNSFDTLRAILTFCILVYHFLMVFFPNELHIFKGGFLAVEVFFVLSGFLIVRMLLTGKYSFLSFLSRRFLRLYPSLIFITVSSFLIAFYHGYDIFDYGLMELVYGILSVYNYFLVYAEIPYFDRFQKEMLFLPLWSLSIEVQLYIISGFIISFTRKRQILTYIFLFFIVSSASISYIYFNLLNINPDNIYFRTEARAYAYFIGGLVAIYENNIRSFIASAKTLLRKIAFLISSVLLGLSFVYLDIYRDWFLPFGFIIIDLLSVILLIVIMQKDKNSKLLFKLGVMSYPIFLWHYPIFVIAKNSQGNPYLPIISLFIVLILSYCVHKLLEEPFRKIYQSRSANNRYLALKVLSLTVFIFVVSLAIPYKPQHSVEFNLIQESHIRQETLTDYNLNKEGEIFSLNNEDYKCKAFLIGDSVMLGAAHNLASNFGGLIIDAKVNRSFIEGLEVVKKNLNTIKQCESIVIHLGNNGYPRKNFLEEIIYFIRENTREDINIFFVNLKGARLSWENAFNQNLNQLKEQGKIKVIDWNSIAKQEILYKDGIHLNIKGVLVYTRMIAETLNLNFQDDNLIKSKVIEYIRDQNALNRKHNQNQEKQKLEEIPKDIDDNETNDNNRETQNLNNQQTQKTTTAMYHKSVLHPIFEETFKLSKFI